MFNKVSANVILVCVELQDRRRQIVSPFGKLGKEAALDNGTEFAMWGYASDRAVNDNWLTYPWSRALIENLIVVDLSSNLKVHFCVLRLFACARIVCVTYGICKTTVILHQTFEPCTLGMHLEYVTAELTFHVGISKFWILCLSVRLLPTPPWQGQCSGQTVPVPPL
jgi:hypothetical protein